MVFEIERVSEALDNVTLEMITSIIWNSERLKRVIELLLEVKGYRNMIKEIDDLPLEVILSQNMYKLNGEIKRISEMRITKILNLLGNAISEENLTDEILAKIDVNLDQMNKEWDQISDNFRYKGNNSILLEIVEGFLDITQKRPCPKRSTSNGKYRMNKDSSDERFSSVEYAGSREQENDLYSPDFMMKQHMTDFTKEQAFAKRMSKGSTHRTTEGSVDNKNDAMTFGGISNRFVKISSSINLDIYSDNVSNKSRERSYSPSKGPSSDPRNPKITSRNCSSMKNFQKNKNLSPHHEPSNDKIAFVINKTEETERDTGNFEPLNSKNRSEELPLNQVSKETQKKVSVNVLRAIEERGTSDSQQTIPGKKKDRLNSWNRKDTNKFKKFSTVGTIFEQSDIFSTGKSLDTVSVKNPIRIEGRYTQYQSNGSNIKRNSNHIQNSIGYDPLLKQLNRYGGSFDGGRASAIRKQLSQKSQEIRVEKRDNSQNLNDSRVRRYNLARSDLSSSKSPVIKRRETLNGNVRKRSKTPVRIIKNEDGKYEIITKSPMSPKRDKRFILNSNKELRKYKKISKDEENRKNLFKEASPSSVEQEKEKEIVPLGRCENPEICNIEDIISKEEFSLNGSGLNDISFVDSFNFYGATIEGDIYAYQLDSNETLKQLEVETLDHIKDLLIDSDHHIVFTQLQSGAFLAGVSGNKFICNTSQSIDASRGITYFPKFRQIAVVTGNKSIESFSQDEEYCRSGFLCLDLPINSGDIKHVIPGKVGWSKAFILTHLGEIIHVGSDGGIAHVQVAKRSKTFYP